MRVLDLSHQYSGALAASLLADLGADVIVVEHPNQSPIRTMLPRKDGESLWWKVIQRGKRSITLDLSTPEGQDIVKRLGKECDVIVENFRAGTLEKWDLGPASLEQAGLDLVLLRISGFGQTGPYSDQPGFGTVAEAMSGFAHLNGEPDGPPIFPSTTLADGVAAVFGVVGVLAAAWNRKTVGDVRHGVEVVDMALFEGLFRLIPTQIPALDQLGIIQSRPGNLLSSHGVLRNLYQSKDEEFLCISAVGEAAIRRVLLAAHLHSLEEELTAGAMRSHPGDVQSFLDKCNSELETWASQSMYDKMARELREGDVVFFGVYSAADILVDPQYAARSDLIKVPDTDLGEVLMPGVVPKFPLRQHHVASAGPPKGQNTNEILASIGYSPAEIDELGDRGAI